jgi:signal transduction histidine kinase
MRTVRMRLTLLYGGAFLLSGTGLIALVYALVAHTTFAGPPPPAVPDLPAPLLVPAPTPPALDSFLQVQLDRQRAAVLDQLLTSSIGALAVMAVVSMALGWLVAGRVLRPLHVMTSTVRAITADRLDQRLAASGPDDELKRLSDTFDDLLDRIEEAFDAQRRFVANASHELRTPLALQRATAEIALADPDADVPALRTTLAKVLTVTADQERMIDALLTLARGQQSPLAVATLDLGGITRKVVDGRRAGANLGVVADLLPAVIVGDAELIERLVDNLVDNAIRHNTTSGWIRVRTAPTDDGAVLRVANSGTIVPAADIPRLLLPFRRLGSDRTGRGHGLGLAIVAAIAEAHHARIHVEPLPPVRVHAFRRGTSGARSTDGRFASLALGLVIAALLTATQLVGRAMSSAQGWSGFAGAGALLLVALLAVHTVGWVLRYSADWILSYFTSGLFQPPAGLPSDRRLLLTVTPRTSRSGSSRAATRPRSPRRWAGSSPYPPSSGWRSSSSPPLGSRSGLRGAGGQDRAGGGSGTSGAGMTRSRRSVSFFRGSSGPASFWPSGSRFCRS